MSPLSATFTRLYGLHGWLALGAFACVLQPGTKGLALHAPAMSYQLPSTCDVHPRAGFRDGVATEEAAAPVDRVIDGDQGRAPRRDLEFVQIGLVAVAGSHDRQLAGGCRVRTGTIAVLNASTGAIARLMPIAG